MAGLRLAFLTVLLFRSPPSFAQGPSGDPAGGVHPCWFAWMQFDTCCLPPPDGNPGCWDQYYTYRRCCTPASGGGRGGVDINSVDDISSLGGCELNIFQDFKGRAGAWYKENRPNIVLFQEFGLIVTRFDSMFESCAPAALTALLLKLESIYFEEDARFDELFAVYVERHHQAVAEGSLLESHHRNGWPLVEGVTKVNRLRGLGRAKRQEEEVAPAAERGSRVASEVVDIVICYCGGKERIEWLRAFQRMPWRDEDRSATTRERVALRFYHKCGGTKDAERLAERRRLESDWSHVFREVQVRYVEDAVRADDCSAYLAYVKDRYDDLPEFTVFLHADAPEHVPDIGLLMDTVYAAARGYLPQDVGFLHLAHNYVNHTQSEPAKTMSQDLFEVSQLWRNVFHSSTVPSMAEGDLSAYCCVQFLVRRERIRLRKRSFYEEALTYFGETASSYHALFPVGRVVWEPDTRGRTPCQLAMYIWHVVFGEELRLPRRHRDPRLPLFIRMQNTEMEAVTEAMAGADGPDTSGFEMIGQTGTDATYYRLQSLFSERQ